MRSSATPDPDSGLDRYTARPATAAITIRPGYADDVSAIAQLAALDSALCVPPAPLLVAEVDGELRVALSLRDGAVVADPFFPTLDVITLLRAHAAVVAPRRRWRDGRRGRARHLMPRSHPQASGA